MKPVFFSTNDEKFRFCISYIIANKQSGYINKTDFLTKYYIFSLGKPKKFSCQNGLVKFNTSQISYFVSSTNFI